MGGVPLPGPAAARVPVGRAARATRVAGLLAQLLGDRDPSGRAQRIAGTLAELRGAALKLAQFLSLQGDALPPELHAALERIRDHAAVVPFSTVEVMLRRELGPRWRARFAELDPEPLAAASIGQVHAARALDGRELALKVQYPGIERSIAVDVELAALLMRGGGLLPEGADLAPVLARVKRELQREADYRRESRSARAYRAWLAGDPDLEVPAVHEDLSTRRVLASDRVRGRPLEDLRSPEHHRSLRDRLGRALLALALRELLELRKVQTDPNFANYLFLPGAGRLALLDFGSLLDVPRALALGYRALLLAAVDGEDRDVLEAGCALGALRGDESEPGRTAWLALARASVEPLRARAPYDFAASDLGSRVRALLARAYRSTDLPVPPAELLLVQRKLAGTFLALAHIGARVDGRELRVYWQ